VVSGEGEAHPVVVGRSGTFIISQSPAASSARSWHRLLRGYKRPAAWLTRPASELKQARTSEATMAADRSRRFHHNATVVTASTASTAPDVTDSAITARMAVTEASELAADHSDHGGQGDHCVAVATANFDTRVGSRRSRRSRRTRDSRRPWRRARRGPRSQQSPLRASEQGVSLLLAGGQGERAAAEKVRAGLKGTIYLVDCYFLGNRN
jgi:hypothetical protein